MTQPKQIYNRGDVVTDNLATVAETEIDRIIGTLPMGNIDAALRHTLGL